MINQPEIRGSPFGMTVGDLGKSMALVASLPIVGGSDVWFGGEGYPLRDLGVQTPKPPISASNSG